MLIYFLYPFYNPFANLLETLFIFILCLVFCWCWYILYFGFFFILYYHF